MFLEILIVVLVSVASQGFSIESRIVNGEDAKIDEFPYQISIQYLGSHNCGGSILNEFYVITAAHCVIGALLEYTTVVAGTINKQQPGSLHQALEIKVHEDYNVYDTVNDIALIKVHPPFVFSNSTGKVDLPFPGQDIPTDTPVVVSGWGMLDTIYSSSPDILKKVTLYVANQEDCCATLEQVHLAVTKTHICVYDKYERKGECKGDSGGPLTIGNKLVGIVSFSYKEQGLYCASTKYPGVYTRVSEYIGWIVSHTRN